MRAVQLLQYGQTFNCAHKVSLTVLGAKQILIRIKAAPINPSDLNFSRGRYGFRHQLPTIAGFEGAGIVTQVGEGVDQGLLHKSVACWSDNKINSGTWADYLVTSQDNIWQIDEKEPDYSKYCSSFINPFTAMGFLDLAQRAQTNSVLLNAGGGALAKIAVRVFAAHSIATTVLVRRDESTKELKELGATYVLNENTDEKILHYLYDQQKIKLFFDAVGGDAAASTLQLLPNGAQLVSYGRFSKQPIGAIDPQQLIFNQKSIRGFWVSQWYATACDTARKNSIKDFVQKNFDKFFQSKIYRRFSIEEIQEAVRVHEESGGAQGKVVLTMN